MTEPTDPVLPGPPVGAVWQPPVLRATALAKRWPGSAGLAATTFAVAPGELVAILGRPGSGKTTLLGLLAGDFLPDDGAIERAGDWVVDDAWRTWRHTAVIPARPALAPESTIAEQVAAVLRSLGVERAQRPPLVLHVLDRLGLVAVGSRLPDELSPGQAQRVAVARAVAGTVAGSVPTLVLADEPTSHQAGDDATLVVAALAETAAAGAAVVVTTDDDRLAERSRVVVLD